MVLSIDLIMRPARWRSIPETWSHFGRLQLLPLGRFSSRERNLLSALGYFFQQARVSQDLGVRDFFPLE